MDDLQTIEIRIPPYLTTPDISGASGVILRYSTSRMRLQKPAGFNHKNKTINCAKSWGCDTLKAQEIGYCAAF